VAAPDLRIARAVGGALLAGLCASGTCTVEVSHDHDCDDVDDRGCGDAGELAAPPAVYAVLVIDAAGAVRRGVALGPGGAAR
jgi:hypothetical protein